MRNKNDNKNGFTRTPKFSVTPKGGGFTIIETMIAVSLFLVVVMAGMGALLNANLLQQKSNDMRSIMDNLSFIMEDMSSNLKTGYKYRCLVDGDDFSDISTPKSCPDGDGIGIAFEHQNGIPSDNEDQWVYLIGDYGVGPGIYRSTKSGVQDTFVQLNPNEFTLGAGSGFTVIGAQPPDPDTCASSPNYDCKQPFVKINLDGMIESKGFETPFSLQTSVSQRKLDVPPASTAQTNESGS